MSSIIRAPSVNGSDPDDDLPNPSRRGVAPKHSAFIDAFIANGGNAKAAAMSVGYAESRAKQSGCNLLRRPAIRKEIQRRLHEASLDSERVVYEISRLVAFDPSEIESRCYRKDEDGRRVVDWEVVRRLGAGSMVREVSTSGKAGHETIRWYSRLEALSLLARIHGLTRDRLQVELVDVRRATDEELQRLAES